MTLSDRERDRIVSLIFQHGYSVDTIESCAVLINCHVNTVRNIWNQLVDSGSSDAKRARVQKPTYGALSAGDRALLFDLLSTAPDMYVMELAEAIYRVNGNHYTPSQIEHTLLKDGFTRKVRSQLIS